MAEINIRRKRKPMWPWVILILALIVAMMFWYWRGSDERDHTVNPTSYRQAHSVETPAVRPAVQYSSFS